MDMRKEIRYRLDAPAIFTWENFQNKRLQGEGITRDISLLGAFILTPTCPPNLTSIQVELALPSMTGISADIRILGEARVAHNSYISVLVEEGRGQGGLILVDWRGRVGWARSTKLMPVGFMSPALAEPELPF